MATKKKENKPLKALFAASEVVPFSKTGGLADVSGSLPIALSKLGTDIRVITPLYRQKTDIKKTRPHSKVTVEMNDKKIVVDIRQAEFPNTTIPCLFVDYPEYFDREELYSYPDDAERFALFSKAVYAHLLAEGDYDIFHGNDWQTGPVFYFIKSRGIKCRSLLTIHNLQYQGLFAPEMIEAAGLDKSLFYPGGPVEYYGKLGYMKTGITFADAVNTVSEGYAKEIQTPEYGEGLEGVLKEKGVVGILNGIDTEVWNPAADKHLAATYNYCDLSGKKKDKKDLQKKFGLPAEDDTPLIGIISRLADQKGFDILLESFDEIMSFPIQIVLLGTGQEIYHKEFTKMNKKYKQKFGLELGFNNALAHQIEAGSDFFLMPSRFEPCGLNQMYSLRYGTVPVVRATGGLADTIIDIDHNPIVGNGFSFEEYKGEALVDAVKRAVACYNRKDGWKDIIVRIMTADISVEASARKYLEVYHCLENSPAKKEAAVI
ncbi:MAG: glycogen synthase GlgA [Chloroflexi bacterium]|nr:glycogen synthase GlgA [Chloroflexota bacterium]